MGGTIETKDRQLDYLQKRFELLAGVVEGMDADSASVAELDSILSMIDDIETKCKQFRKDWPSA
ncbi:SE1561 family protein [Shouchella patagoniensis]|uniref:SE1561 family protein n=1 Tax=Shouchella patagoniensis TaxID=228576 RepID=UPI0009955631|nr:SE1561 family protein [Shouchella patagoniensis]